MKRRILTSKDVAEIRGISRRAAGLWLAKLEAKHGPTVVGRVERGKDGQFYRYTTPAALRKISPEWVDHLIDLEAKVEELALRVAKLERTDRERLGIS